MAERFLGDLAKNLENFSPNHPKTFLPFFIRLQVDIDINYMLHFWIPSKVPRSEKQRDHECQLNSHNRYGPSSLMPASPYSIHSPLLLKSVTVSVNNLT